MSNQFEVRLTEKMSHIHFLACKEVVQANDVVTFFDQSLAKMRSKKPSSTGDEDSLNGRHVWGYSLSEVQGVRYDERDKQISLRRLPFVPFGR